jgi:predicted Rdx family selenoprotein
LESRFGEKVQILEGSRGQFDVLADDQLLFSKHEIGRFPNQNEVEDRLSMLKKGEELPPLPQANRRWFVSRLMSRLTG